MTPDPEVSKGPTGSRIWQAGTVTAILLDFFGTLVTYSPTRTRDGYHDTFAIMREHGWTASYADWLALWSDTFDDMDRAAEKTGVEFSVHEILTEFGVRSGLPPLASGDRYVATYLRDWCRHPQAPAQDLRSSVARPRCIRRPSDFCG
jgi:hypothetical protein